MINKELRKIFEDMADILEIKGVDWKPLAFRKAARSIDSSDDLKIIYEKEGLQGLMQLDGVGERIANKIQEYIITSKIKEYEQLKKSLPEDIIKMMEIPGLGPKKILRLHNELKIKTLDDLESAIQHHKIQQLEGFGEKSEQDILLGLKIYKKGLERMLLADAMVVAGDIVKKLKDKNVIKITLGGSLLRKKETIGDIDILILSNNADEVMDKFVSLSNVKHVIAKGASKSTVLLKEGINCEIKIVPKKSFGSALNYFTGNKDHNVRLRQIAINKGMKLSEYGLFNKKTNKYLSGEDEKDIYKKLGLSYIEPELRENTGEIEAAKSNKLPKLVNIEDIKGDCHMHTNVTDGQNSIAEMINASQKLNYDYIAITDHSKSTIIANGLTKRRLFNHIKNIEKIEKKSNIRVFNGAEVDILEDGKLDYNNKVLKELDIIGISIHRRFKMDKQEMTKRIITAMENPNVNFLAHPTGRLIHQREPYELDWEKIFQTAKDNNVALEINSQPSRLDLNDVHIKSAIENKIKLIINSDSHSVNGLSNINFGVYQARRGWAEAKDIINTFPLKKFEALILK